MSCSRLKVLTSSHWGTLGQCRASTARQYGSISTCPTQRMPALSKPRSMPPMPENSDRKLSALLTGALLPRGRLKRETGWGVLPCRRR